MQSRVKCFTLAAHFGHAEFFKGIPHLPADHFDPLAQIISRTVLLFQRTLEIILHGKELAHRFCRSISINGFFFTLRPFAVIVIFRSGPQKQVFLTGKLFLGSFQLFLGVAEFFAQAFRRIFRFWLLCLPLLRRGFLRLFFRRLCLLLFGCRAGLFSAPGHSVFLFFLTQRTVSFP